MLDASRATFEAMGPGLAYAKDPEHPMARSVLSCAALLAIFLNRPGRRRSARTEFGSAMLANMAEGDCRGPRKGGRQGAECNERRGMTGQGSIS